MCQVRLWLAVIGASMDMIGWLQLLRLTWMSLAGNNIIIIMVAIGFPHLPIVTIVSGYFWRGAIVCCTVVLKLHGIACLCCQSFESCHIIVQ